MSYKYITSDNLEIKQDYMYSVYAGLDFLQAYYESRRRFIKHNSTVLCVRLRGRN